MRALAVALVVPALVAAALLGTGCGPAPAPALDPAGPPPNLLLVTLCSLRVDRVGAFGYATRDTTPRIDALAREGVVFTRAWANATWTNAAHASLLTGLLPGHHRLTDDADAIVDGAPTLAALLAEQGWRTAALLQETGPMALGDHTHLTRDFGARWDHRDLRAWRPDALADWAAADPAPFFALVHLREAHLPFGTGAPFVDPADVDPRVQKWQAALPRPGSMGARVWTEPTDPHLWLRDAIVADPSLQADLDLVYDAGVHAADASLGRLLDAFAARGVLDDTVVVVVGDHGEALVGHKERLDRGVLHVPLVIRLPNGVGAGTRVQDDVGQVDLFPTLLDLAGVALPRVLDGRTLAPLLRGDARDARPVLTQSIYRDGEGAVWRREAIVGGDLRLVQLTGTEYEIERERPDGRIVVERERSPQADALYASLREQGRGTVVPEAGVVAVPDATREDMQKRGYW